MQNSSDKFNFDKMDEHDSSSSKRSTNRKRSTEGSDDEAEVKISDNIDFGDEPKNELDLDDFDVHHQKHYQSGHSPAKKHDKNMKKISSSKFEELEDEDDVALRSYNKTTDIKQKLKSMSAGRRNFESVL